VRFIVSFSSELPDFAPRYLCCCSAHSAAKIFEEEEEMISQSLVELIEKNADNLAKQWLNDVKHNAHTPFYHTFDEDLLYQRAFNLYKGLGQFLSIQTPKKQTVKY